MPRTRPDGKKTQIVVVGGGAGGLELVTKLGANLSRQDFDIILVDRNATHIWKPLLHEVAAGSLDANLDEVGYRGHAFRWGYRYFDGALEDIDRAAKQIVVAPIIDEDGNEVIGRHRIRYDYLVMAVGSVSNDFGTPGVRENTISLDTRADADRFRRRLLNQCLRVSRQMTADPDAESYARVAIVGGGATGVELAAELYSAATALGFYGLEVFDEKRLQVTLIEAGPRILPALPDKLAASATAELEALGVRVLANTPVTSATPEAIITKSGEVIGADIMVWAAGVKGAPFLANIGGLETTRNNQLVVGSTLQTTLDDCIFAIGDCAYYVPEGQGRPIPPRAQAAHQMATTVYHNLRAAIAGKPMRDFVYRDKGSLVSLARYTTVGSLMGNLVGGRMAIEGRLARLVYTSLYRMHLLAIHGWVKGFSLLLVGHVNQVVRPQLKLH
ncbi:NAD(P)/FAD-dependent oxidoreductase [Polymorphobacter fuscus]|uniref:FAD-dependent oxidoreductase n=1 Tax=Sandarakinorhabdus fusca TaxID=1439888 RepID=A0A7C9KXT7_9SPHN|nr:NAD(P)/FAD-dependent oxidoreductase [Polymorphobacter fuscus]KAB7646216.1 NAD(P)/FAD-dependent oxidoreductase [Polymorphobacter fuscus]MQT17426.1 FAD-dependent oxidoreductase [Polymorphobacter fuscus]NJC10039.1 NADH dehydrogenase [Polymorphobacter fuscus]